ncbi:Tetraacyldisaccharide 4'-kinase [Gossypium arboreum]|uniref:Tetraacyldisaccharide 4'-kinase n=1 Tax=Gossypium arboreum TaxID=29729 RepID=A0A0B0MF12_GOSAR|nr:Tetraacyldisaccharide 4'-kinase [Gossypium arboreum]
MPMSPQKWAFPNWTQLGLSGTRPWHMPVLNYFRPCSSLPN